MKTYGHTQKGRADHYLRNVPHGTIIITRHVARKLGINNQAVLSAMHYLESNLVIRVEKVMSGRNSRYQIFKSRTQSHTQ